MKAHVPYRDSMMTSVLRDSLGGNCFCLMLHHSPCVSFSVVATSLFFQGRTTMVGCIAAEARLLTMNCCEKGIVKACRHPTFLSPYPLAATWLQTLPILRLLFRLKPHGRLCAASCSDHKQCSGKRGASHVHKYAACLHVPWLRSFDWSNPLEAQNV